MSTLRRIRQERGLSLNDVERLCGIDIGHLSRLERGEYEPTIRTLRMLGGVYGYSTSLIVGLMEAEEQQEARSLGREALTTQGKKKRRSGQADGAQTKAGRLCKTQAKLTRLNL